MEQRVTHNILPSRENSICYLTFEPCQRFPHLPQSHSSLLHVLQGHYSVCRCRLFLQWNYILLQLTAETNKMHNGKGEEFRAEQDNPVFFYNNWLVNRMEMNGSTWSDVLMCICHSTLQTLFGFVSVILTFIYLGRIWLRDRQKNRQIVTLLKFHLRFKNTRGQDTIICQSHIDTDWAKVKANFETWSIKKVKTVDHM